MTGRLVLITGAVNLALILCMSAVVFFRNKRAALKGFSSYISAAAALTAWILFYALQMLDLGLEPKRFFFMLECVGAAAFLFSVCRLLFFSEFSSAPPKAILYSILVYDVIFFFCMWGNPGLLFLEGFVADPYSLVTPVFGPLFYVLAGSTLAAVFAVAVVYAVLFFKRRGIRHALMAAALIVFTALEVLFISGVLRTDFALLTAAAPFALITVCMLFLSDGDVLPYIKKNIFNLLNDAIIIFAADGRIEYSNPQAERLLKCASGFLKGKTLAAVNPAFPDFTDGRNYSEAHIEIESPQTLSFHLIELKPGQGMGRMVVIRDITNQRTNEDKLYYLLNYDDNTGLLTDAALMKTMNDYCARAGTLENCSIFAASIANYDSLKGAMDIDQEARLARAVAAYLNSNLFGEYYLASRNANEYYIFTPRTFSIERVILICEKMTKTTLFVGEESYALEFNVGYYKIGRNVTPVEAMTNAGYALKTASPEQRLCVYDEGMREHMRIAKQLLRYTDGTAEDGTFFMQYQPVFDAVDMRILGVEALIRWRHPELGLVSPAQFIPIAENSSAIVNIGLYAIRRACLEFREWGIEGDFRLCVNVSKRQIDDPGFVEKLIKVIRETGVSPKNLEFEITETSVSNNISNVMHFVETVRRLGSRISLDDFGSGNTSLAFITDLKCSTVKLDVSMTHGVLTDPQKGLILKSMPEMLKGIDIIVEHVENMEILSYIKELGYRNIQGYIFSEPLSPEDFKRLYDVYRKG